MSRYTPGVSWCPGTHQECLGVQVHTRSVLVCRYTPGVSWCPGTHQECLGVQLHLHTRSVLVCSYTPGAHNDTPMSIERCHSDDNLL